MRAFYLLAALLGTVALAMPVPDESPEEDGIVIADGFKFRREYNEPIVQDDIVVGDGFKMKREYDEEFSPEDIAIADGF